MKDRKLYNIFITITSFAKLLIEVFIPLFLYNKEFGINDILFFYLITFITIFISAIPTSFLGEKIKFKNTMILSTIFFSAFNIYVNFVNNKLGLIILGIINGLYLILYWVGRHLFGVSIIKEKQTTDNVSLYMIFTIIGSIPASYIGAILIDKLNYFYLSLIVFLISLVSIIPLSKIKTNLKKHKINIKNIIKTYPKRNYIFYFFDQFKFMTILLFPLYIYLNISKTLKFIGITNIVIGISSVIYIYFLSKLMDNKKKSFLKPMLLFLFLTFLIKLNINTKTIMIIIIFIEGIFKSALDTIILRNTYSYCKDYDNVSYITFIEMIYALFRIIVVTLLLSLKISLKGILYIGTFSLLINTFIGFKVGKNGYEQN